MILDKVDLCEAYAAWLALDISLQFDWCIAHAQV